MSALMLASALPAPGSLAQALSQLCLNHSSVLGGPRWQRGTAHPGQGTAESSQPCFTWGLSAALKSPFVFSRLFVPSLLLHYRDRVAAATAGQCPCLCGSRAWQMCWEPLPAQYMAPGQGEVSLSASAKELLSPTQGPPVSRMWGLLFRDSPRVTRVAGICVSHKMEGGNVHSPSYELDGDNSQLQER